MYVVVELYSKNGLIKADIVSLLHENLRDAEMVRSKYLQEFQEINPQNVKVVQYTS